MGSVSMDFGSCPTGSAGMEVVAQEFSEMRLARPHYRTTEILGKEATIAAPAVFSVIPIERGASSLGEMGLAKLRITHTRGIAAERVALLGKKRRRSIGDEKVAPQEIFPKRGVQDTSFSMSKELTGSSLGIVIREEARSSRKEIPPCYFAVDLAMKKLDEISAYLTNDGGSLPEVLKQILQSSVTTVNRLVKEENASLFCYEVTLLDAVMQKIGRDHEDLSEQLLHEFLLAFLPFKGQEQPNNFIISLFAAMLSLGTNEENIRTVVEFLDPLTSHIDRESLSTSDDMVPCAAALSGEVSKPYISPEESSQFMSHFDKIYDINPSLALLLIDVSWLLSLEVVLQTMKERSGDSLKKWIPALVCYFLSKGASELHAKYLYEIIALLDAEVVITREQTKRLLQHIYLLLDTHTDVASKVVERLMVPHAGDLMMALYENQALLEDARFTSLLRLNWDLESD